MRKNSKVLQLIFKLFQGLFGFFKKWIILMKLELNSQN